MKKMTGFIVAFMMPALLLAGAVCTQQANAAEDTGGEISGTLEVAVFSNGDAMDEFWQAAVAEFNKWYPDCEVILAANPKIEDSIRPRFVAGNPPDIYYMGGTANVDEAALTADGQFMDLKEFYASAQAPDRDGLLKDRLAAEVFNRVGDSIYGMAFAYNVWGYYYNAAMAQEYGWTPPENWEEFCELAPRIKAEGIYPLIHQGKYPDYIGYGLLQPGLATDYGKELLVRMGNLDVDAYRSDEVLGAYQKLETLREQDWTPASALSLTHTEAQMEWLQGKAFMIPCGNWLEGEMANDIPEGFDMAFMPTFWHDGDHSPVYVASGGRVSIPLQAKNPEAAKAFLQVLFSKEMTRKIVECNMGIPCVNDELDDAELVPSCKNVMEQVKEGTAEIINEVGGSGNFEPYAEQRTATTNAIAAILGGQSSAKEAVDQLADEIERIAADSAIIKTEIF